MNTVIGVAGRSLHNSSQMPSDHSLSDSQRGQAKVKCHTMTSVSGQSQIPSVQRGHPDDNQPPLDRQTHSPLRSPPARSCSSLFLGAGQQGDPAKRQSVEPTLTPVGVCYDDTCCTARSNSHVCSGSAGDKDTTFPALLGRKTCGPVDWVGCSRVDARLQCTTEECVRHSRTTDQCTGQWSADCVFSDPGERNLGENDTSSTFRTAVLKARLGLCTNFVHSRAGLLRGHYHHHHHHHHHHGCIGRLSSQHGRLRNFKCTVKHCLASLHCACSSLWDVFRWWNIFLKLLLLLLLLSAPANSDTVRANVTVRVKVVVVERCHSTFSPESIGPTLTHATSEVDSFVSVSFTQESYCQQRNAIENLSTIFEGGDTDVVVGLAPYDLQTILSTSAALYNSTYIACNVHVPRSTTREHSVVSVIPSFRQVSGVLRLLLSRLEWQRVALVVSDDSYWLDLGAEVHVHLSSEGFRVHGLQVLRVGSRSMETERVLSRVRPASKGGFCVVTFMCVCRDVCFALVGEPLLLLLVVIVVGLVVVFIVMMVVTVMAVVACVNVSVCVCEREEV